MTALFLNLNASWWDVYKVDLEGNIKKKKPNQKWNNMVMKKKVIRLRKTLSFKLFFYSLFLLVSNIKSFHSSPTTLIIVKYLKVIFPFIFSSRTKPMEKKKKEREIIIHLFLPGIPITVCQIFITTWGISARLSFCEFLKLMTFRVLCSLLV